MGRDALVVGINNYQYLPQLNASALDSEAVAQVLSEAGEFQKIVRLPETITRLVTTNDKQPIVSKSEHVSCEQLKISLQQLFLPRGIQIPSTAVFYFSGHGIPDLEGYDKGYLATSDTHPSKPNSGLSLRWLQWLLSKSPVKNQIIWLDCCHSGAIINLDEANPDHRDNRHNRCFIASSRDFEPSWEHLNSPHSTLTKALLEGLRPERSPGRWIDTFSLVDYINQALKSDLQTPICTNFGGEPIKLTKAWSVDEPISDNWVADIDTSPYKGLEFFDYGNEDPKYFFGREQLVSHLIARLHAKKFVALIGASGSGKSSVLRAGLLHQIDSGKRISGSSQWKICLTRPDIKPLQSLALAFIDKESSDISRAKELSQATELFSRDPAGLSQLVNASSAPRIVLVIDQFEEIFTRCQNTVERDQFFACLMQALTETGDKLRLVIAIRSDFVGKCLEAEYSGLSQEMLRNMVSVLPMGRSEIRDAICRPAETVGLKIEPVLVTEMLNDITRAPGSLPLLQYTLKILWQRRTNNSLQLSEYQELGGIDGTLDRMATEVYSSFDSVEKQTFQHIFQQLTQLGEGTEDTRRRVFQEDLVAAPQHPASRVQHVVEKLASKEYRLLVTSNVESDEIEASHVAIVDVAHEALIRHWDLLRQWIEENRDLLRKQRKIEASARVWREKQRSLGYLLYGVPLTEAIQFEKQQKSERFPLSDSAMKFIRQSRKQRRKGRLKAATWLILSTLLIAGTIESRLRESAIKLDYARLGQEGTYEEKQAVISLVKGCIHPFRLPYISELLFGNCRSLSKTPLEKADLSGTWLTGADFSDTELNYVDFSDAGLVRADLSSANLNEAILQGANLGSANLEWTRFEQTDLSKVDLGDVEAERAGFSEVNLEKADLRDANFQEAVFSDVILDFADLRNTNFREAGFYDVSLKSANLQGANLRLAKIRRVDLSFSELDNADLSSVEIEDANFADVNLTNTVLGSIDPSVVNLSGAVLLNTDLRSNYRMELEHIVGDDAPFLCNTRLPSDIKDLVDKDRDCNKLAAVLFKRSSDERFAGDFRQDFFSIENAQEFVDQERQKRLEDS